MIFTYSALTPSPLNTSPAIGHSFGYDTASRLQSASDGSYSALYSYLANSMLISQVLLQQSGSTRMTTTKQYDNLNRLTQIMAAPASAVPWSFRYGHDDAALGTDQAYQRIQSTWSDTSYWLYAYDKLGQAAGGKRYWSDKTLVAGQRYEYVYDDIGNRTLVRMGGDEAGGNLREAGYSPTLLNEYSSRVVPPVIDIVGMAGRDVLVTANNSYPYRKGEYFYQGYQTGGGPAYLYQSVSAGGTWTGGYVYLPSNPENFLYDLDGNITRDGRWSYTWDGENRLTALESYYGPDYSKRRQEFEYDCLGRCIRKKTYTWTSGYYQLATDTKYLYEGWRVVAELNASNGLVRSYLWGLDLSGTRDGAGGVGGLVELTSYSPSTTHHFYACDGNGNVAGLVDASSGAASAQYEYGPFGELIRMTGTMGKVNPFRWSCKLTDDDTDLAYYGYRYYNPSTGRWLSRDPAEEKGGLNLYGFVRNDPLDGTDVLGEWLANVHFNLTGTSAYGQGITGRYALIVANADQDVDNNWTTGPIFGGQDRHLYYDRGGIDSRDYWYLTELAEAIAALERFDCAAAAKAFGRGLHSAQDLSAHRRYMEVDGTVVNWPHAIAHPAWWDDYGALGQESGSHFSQEWWRRRAGRPNSDYDVWRKNSGDQRTSQLTAQRQVELDTTRTISAFVDIVRSRNCYCRKEILGHP